MTKYVYVGINTETGDRLYRAVEEEPQESIYKAIFRPTPAQRDDIVDWRERWAQLFLSGEGIDRLTTIELYMREKPRPTDAEIVQSRLVVEGAIRDYLNDTLRRLLAAGDPDANG